MQKQWFVGYKWLKLNENMETCHCAVCLWAITDNRISPVEKANARDLEVAWRDIKKGKIYLIGIWEETSLTTTRLAQYICWS